MGFDGKFGKIGRNRLSALLLPTSQGLGIQQAKRLGAV
jgi:hypothetical protein